MSEGNEWEGAEPFLDDLDVDPAFAVLVTRNVRSRGVGDGRRFEPGLLGVDAALDGHCCGWGSTSPAALSPGAVLLEDLRCDLHKSDPRQPARDHELP
jgi:hypothetical protein